MRLALLFLAAALVARAPGLLHVELNWDEALYWMIAGEVAQGHAPYTATWDRKPPGLFLLLAVPRGLFGESMLVLRLATVAAVAASALALCHIARRLLPQLPAAGVVAGLVYAGFTTRTGGEGTNAELLLAPFALWGIVLAFSSAQRDRWPPAIAAGALLGAGAMIKQVALFDALAAALMALAMGWPGRVRMLAGMALGGLLAPLAAIAWYAAIGHADLLLANLTAAGAAGEAAVNLEGLWMGVAQLRPLLAGFALGLAALLAVRAWRAALAVALWAGCIAAVLLLLGRFADHMWLQAIPPLALGTGALVAVAAQALPLRLTQPLALLAGVALLGLGAGSQLRGGWETGQRRAAGTPHWGDRTATTAAALAGRLEGPEDVFVMGRTLGVYAAAGQRPPTRIPFSLHFWESYAPLDGTAELARIMAARPRFVILDESWLPGGPRHSEAQARLLDRLAALLEEAGYVRDGQVGRFTSSGGGFVGGGEGVVVFRRPDVPASGGGPIQYEP